MGKQTTISRKLSKSAIETELRDACVKANVYSPFLDIQIRETAAAIFEREKMQEIVNKEGHIITEEGVKGQTKRVANPLCMVINNFNRTITQQMSSIGLNLLRRSNDEDDKYAANVSEFFKKDN